MTITKEQIRATLTRLSGQFPQAFVLANYKPHRPLKVGIAVDIRARCPDLEWRGLAVALSAYTKRIVYLQALVVGAARVDLGGNPAGEVITSEAEHAAARLAEILATREAKRVVIPANPTPAPVASPPLAPPAAAKGLKSKPVLHLRLGQRR